MPSSDIPPELENAPNLAYTQRTGDENGSSPPAQAVPEPAPAAPAPTPEPAGAEPFPWTLEALQELLAPISSEQRRVLIIAMLALGAGFIALLANRRTAAALAELAEEVAALTGEAPGAS
jgi:hypothetical protein